MSGPTWERERPPVKRPCQRCGVTWGHVDGGRVIVSPQGTAHFGASYGVTACGHDATGERWWWPE